MLSKFCKFFVLFSLVMFSHTLAFGSDDLPESENGCFKGVTRVAKGFAGKVREDFLINVIAFTMKPGQSLFHPENMVLLASDVLYIWAGGSLALNSYPWLGAGMFTLFPLFANGELAQNNGKIIHGEKVD